MEIKIDRDNLFRSISRVQSILEKKSNMPILSTILFKSVGTKLYVSATDLELGFQQILEADIIQEGSITISGRKMFEILKESKKSNFHIKEKDNNWVYISDGVARFNLACLPADEYPSFVEPEGVNTIEVDGKILSDMINKTIYSVTLENAGFKLSGVFTEKIDDNGNSILRMVATDGHRLSMVDKKVNDIETLALGNGIMIPKKGMNELNKLASEGGTLHIGFKDKTCVAKKESTLLIIRLLGTNFPDYHAVIPQELLFSIEVNRISALEAMRKMLILSNDSYRAVKIALEDDVMELVSTNPDLGDAQENIQVKYQGQRIEAGFNPQYFIDIFQSMESEIVSLSFVDNSKPCIIKGDVDDGFLGLLMPMRI